ncbi:hypothetical protein [Saccharothrix longispora]|uniref:hypothetical protein n=1 Tax=Saccharothrix longispora TaxID=33920 RepID=UPI0028FDB728|nr:hypothetical protein [Saccharothrix longispora]MDU0289075.1 hypothetical protein [Saccharothrix longispora]
MTTRSAEPTRHLPITTEQAETITSRSAARGRLLLAAGLVLGIAATFLTPLLVGGYPPLAAFARVSNSVAVVMVLAAGVVMLLGRRALDGTRLVLRRTRQLRSGIGLAWAFALLGSLLACAAQGYALTRATGDAGAAWLLLPLYALPILPTSAAVVTGRRLFPV